MTKNEMMRLASEAGLWVTSVERLKAVEKFAELVAAAERDKKEWVGFTQEEHQSAIWTDGSYGAGFLYAEKLLKEKNGN